MATTNLSVVFLCGLRGYHEYKTVWTPILHEIVYAIHERLNRYDHYAIAARKILPGSYQDLLLTCQKNYLELPELQHSTSLGKRVCGQKRCWSQHVLCTS